MSALFTAAILLAPPANAPMQAVINEIKATEAPPIQSIEPRIAREAPSFNDAVISLLSKRGRPAQEQVGDVSHRLIPGGANGAPDGGILVRFYRPRGSRPGQILPMVIYFHGGGYVIANLNTYDATPRALANLTGAVVASVAYRLAPEHKYPAQIDDGLAATKWLMANARSVSADPNRIAIAGESAGGNLATVTCIRLKREGLPLPKHQLLVYPLTDYSRTTDASIEENADAVPLNKPMLAWFGKYYLPKDSDKNDIFVSPFLAPEAELRGLPSATFIQAQIDPLRTQGLDYAAKLKAAGVAVTTHLYNGVTHEFFGMGALIPQAKQAEQVAAREIKAAFAR